jgi:hypothetical protein
MTKAVYLQQVLKGEITTWAAGDWVLEQDRDSGHGFFLTREKIGLQDGSRNPGCSVSKWMKANSIEFYFDPPDSPDLSLIENVWKYVSQKLQALDFVPNSREQLIETINRIWDEMPQEWINLRITGGIDHHGKQIPSMQDRWEDLRVARGDQTGH